MFRRGFQVVGGLLVGRLIAAVFSAADVANDLPGKNVIERHVYERRDDQWEPEDFSGHPPHANRGDDDDGHPEGPWKLFAEVEMLIAANGADLDLWPGGGLGEQLGLVSAFAGDGFFVQDVAKITLSAEDNGFHGCPLKRLWA